MKKTKIITFTDQKGDAVSVFVAEINNQHIKHALANFFLEKRKIPLKDIRFINGGLTTKTYHVAYANRVRPVHVATSHLIGEIG